MSKNVPTNCKKHTLDFIYLKDDANQKALIQDIASDLAKVGVTANLKPLEKGGFLNKNLTVVTLIG